MAKVKFKISVSVRFGRGRSTRSRQRVAGWVALAVVLIGGGSVGVGVDGRVFEACRSVGHGAQSCTDTPPGLQVV